MELWHAIQILTFEAFLEVKYFATSSRISGMSGF
jgi:hypothetical protein